MNQPRTLHVLPSFHYDVAYLERYDDYLPIVFGNIDTALRMLEAHPEYRFVLEQTIALEAYWERHPEAREPLRRLAREGRLEVAPGMFVMPDMNIPTGESLFRQIRLGRAWLREHLGVVPTVAWIADCWGHHAQLPQVLRSCGYDYYVFWRCMRRDVRRNDFVWQGLDGTEIRTHWLALGYSNIRFPDDAEVLNVRDLGLHGARPEEVRRLVDALATYGPSDELLICNAGDFLPPQASAPAAVAALHAHPELPDVRFSTAREFLDSVAWDEAPRVRGEFNSSMQGTFTSNIRLKQRNFEATRTLGALEALAVVMGAPSDHDPLWRPILKQQFHDILCGTICDGALEDAHAEYDEADRTIATAISALAEPEGERAFFNPLPFDRIASVQDGDGRHVVRLPAMGFAAAPAHVARDRAAGRPRDARLPLEFENEHLRCRIGTDGFVTRLEAGDGGADVVGPGLVPFGALTLQMDYGDPWLNFEGPLAGGSEASSLVQNEPDPLDRSTPGELVNRGTVVGRPRRAWVESETDDDVVIAQEGTLSFWRVRLHYTTRLRLARHAPWLEYRTTIEPESRHVRLRVAFPTSIRGGRLLHEIPFGVAERGSGEHPAQSWVEYGSDDAGVAILNRGTPGHSLDGSTLLMSLFRSVAMEYKAPSRLSYGEGVPHTFGYAVRPRAERDLAGLVRHAHAFAQPPIPVRVARERLGTPQWAVSAPNVVLSALRWDGAEVDLRLYEATGSPGRGSVTLPDAALEYAPTDGLGTPTEAWRTSGGVLPFDLGAFSIQAYRLRWPPGARCAPAAR